MQSSRVVSVNGIEIFLREQGEGPDMERILPNLKQKLIIDGAGHWIQQECPDQVNAALIGFLKQAIPS